MAPLAWAKPNAKGAELFATNCASCHGVDGKGLREFGAPNLADGIWLYGGDKATLTETVKYSRQGVMPRWKDKLDAATIKMLAAYVYSLGGGEATPAAAVPAAAPATPAKAAKTRRVTATSSRASRSSRVKRFAA